MKKRRSIQKIAVRAGVLAVMLSILLTVFMSGGSGSVAAAQSVVSLFDGVIDTNRDSFFDSSVIYRLAAIAGVSEGHFCRLFKEYTHMRPMEYVAHLRIETAKSLLINSPGMTVSSISRQVGYASPSYFSAVFRAAEGMTPAEYREKQE